jgi:hypothetical protein
VSVQSASVGTGQNSHASAKPYVFGGAIAAVIVAGYFIKRAVEDSHDEMMMPPFVLAVPLLGAALVGAGAGYIVFRITR